MRALPLAVVLSFLPRLASADTPVEPVSLEWRQEPDRWFAAGLIDIGPRYLRPRLSAGFGRPFWRWIGVDTNPLLSAEGIGFYGGVSGTTSRLALRAGTRCFSTFSRSLLAPKYSYDRLDLELRDGPASRYCSIESELTGRLPLGPGSILAVLSGTYVTFVPDDRLVYEDTLHVVAKPPWIWLARTGYEMGFMRHRRARVAVVAELVGSPGRDLVVVRGGFTASFTLGKILELRAALVPALFARDDLGAMGGQWFELGLRFRFATGTPARLELPSI